MAYSQSWLESQSAVRAVFVEVGYLDVLLDEEKVLYLSSAGYVTNDGLTSFLPIISDGVQMSESLSLSGGASFSLGDIGIYNNNGEYDDWLDPTKYIWVNRPINIYLGDPLWVTESITTLKTNFLQIFSGLVVDVDSRNRDTLNIRIRDKLEKLNTPISEEKFPSYGTWVGDQPNLDKIIPLVFGEVFNIEPELINPAALEYRFNKDASTDLIEIRDSGVPIYSASGIKTPSLAEATINLTTSTFTLNTPPIGTITCSVQGVKKHIDLTTGVLSTSTYTNKAIELIAVIVSQYGKTGDPALSVSELDLSNLATMNALATGMCGIYIPDRANLLQVCTTLAESFGMQIYIDRLGKLKVLRVGTPLGSLVGIDESDILHRSLVISKRCEVIASSKIGYCKNWTVQSDLLTGIPVEHKKNFATEWYSALYKNTTAIGVYKLFADPEQRDSAHQTKAGAEAEAEREVNYWSIPRTIYKFTGTSRLLSLQLGQPVTLTHHRYGLHEGKTGQVYSLAPNWLSSTIEVEVII